MNIERSENKFARTMFLMVMLSVPFFVSGQRGYQTGFIITMDYDTVNGMIRDRKPQPFEELYRRIRFRGDGVFTQRFGPAEIKGYMKGGNYFESLWLDVSYNFFREDYYSVPGRGKRVFMKVLGKGYLTYYSLEYEDSESFRIDEIPLFKKQDDPLMVRVTQGILGIKKKRLSEFFSDCPDLVEKINEGEFREPGEIADFYNKWKANK